MEYRDTLLSASKDKKRASKDIDEILKRSIHEDSDDFEEN